MTGATAGAGVTATATSKYPPGARRVAEQARGATPARRAPRGRRSAAAWATLLAISAGVAACGASPNGEASKAAGQILADAKAATLAASSLHLTGHLNTGAQTVTLDVVAGQSRGGGTVSEGKTSFQVVAQGTEAFIKASAASLRALAESAGASAASTSAASILAGRWLATSTASGGPLASLDQLVLVKPLVGMVSPTGALTKGSRSQLDGQAVIALDDRADHLVVYVATTGKPYIDRVTSTNGGSDVSLTLGSFGSASLPALPKKAVDLDRLLGP